MKTLGTLIEMTGIRKMRLNTMASQIASTERTTDL